MRVKEVRYDIGVTCKLGGGQYDMIRPGGSVTVEVGPKDDIGDAIRFARKNALIAFVKSTDDHLKIQGYIGQHRERFTDKVIAEMISEAITLPEEPV
jgi:hypothetical protein